MLEGIKNFFYRHKRKFFASGIILGGGYVLTLYCRKKFIEWQEKQTKDMIDTARKTNHFESTERTCNQSIISLSISVKEVILKVANADEYLIRLKNGESNRRELWEELKVLVFTKHSALMYSGLMLTVVLRVQLNIVGGYICRETVGTEVNGSLDVMLQERYLTLCRHFTETGAEKLCELIKRHVKLIFQNIPLSKKLSLKDIEDIFWSIQASISNDPMDPLRNLTKYLLPPSSNFNSTAEDNLSKMISETFEVLESEEAISLSKSCLSRGYSNSLDKIAEFLIPNSNSLVAHSSKENGGVGGPSGFTDLNKISLPLAKLIPIVHGLMVEGGSGDEAQPWVQQFITMDKLREFGANLYEAFSFSA